MTDWVVWSRGDAEVSCIYAEEENELEKILRRSKFGEGLPSISETKQRFSDEEKQVILRSIIR